MCRPIRTLTEAKGHDTAVHNLASFGGAGGQHAADIAKILGINRVLIHKYSSILSAYGMALAEVVHEEQLPSAWTYADELLPQIQNTFETLEQKAEQALIEQSISPARITTEKYLNMRYKGSDTAIMVREPTDTKGFLDAFVAMHYQEFGFTPQNAAVIIDDIRIRASGRNSLDYPSFSVQELRDLEEVKTPASTMSNQVYFETFGWTETPVHRLESLPKGCTVAGPAIIIDNTQTIIVPPQCVARLLPSIIAIDIENQAKPQVSTEGSDPIQLTIFGHRFMGISEQMGRALQKTSVSTNIKERLDFSCAVFAPDGSLVSNAPHVPAMIGSMAYAVKWQIQHWGDRLRPGDVILSNSPSCGGVHLPDMTTITPVYDPKGENIIFWTASRGHHADVGGILPGSMPPNSREIWEEGAVFEAFKVVDKGVLDEAGLIDRLMAPAQYPGCSATRCLKDNLSDIRAQIAANNRGSQLIQFLIADYGLEVVQFYMSEIQKAAEMAVRNLLKETAKKRGSKFQAVDYMDDGTAIKLAITIDESTGGAVFDFTGTGREVYGKMISSGKPCYACYIRPSRHLSTNTDTSFLRQATGMLHSPSHILRSYTQSDAWLV